MTLLKQTAAENRRLAALWRYETDLLKQGYQAIAGVDEAGSGPLAGPVMAAAVILNPHAPPLLGLNDSKCLSAKKRDLLYAQIKQQAISWSVAAASVEEIEKLNILQASLLAMHRAVKNLDVPADFLLVDARHLAKIALPQKAIIGGDGLSQSIAAASIMAKVTRDRFMEQADKLYPQYGFARHRGYGTKIHLQALQKVGPCPLHRRCFAPVRRLLASAAEDLLVVAKKSASS